MIDVPSSFLAKHSPPAHIYQKEQIVVKQNRTDRLLLSAKAETNISDGLAPKRCFGLRRLSVLQTFLSL